MMRLGYLIGMDGRPGSGSPSKLGEGVAILTSAWQALT